MLHSSETWEPTKKKTKKPPKQSRCPQKLDLTEDGDPVTEESSRLEPETHQDSPQSPKNSWAVPEKPAPVAKPSQQEQKAEERRPTVIGARELPDFPWDRHSKPNANIKRLMAKINEEDAPILDFKHPNLFESFMTEPLQVLDPEQMTNVIYLQDQLSLIRGRFMVGREQLNQCREQGGKEQKKREQAQWDRSRTRKKCDRLESGLKFFFERSKTHVELAERAKQEKLDSLSESNKNRKELKLQRQVVANIAKEREDIMQEWTNLRSFAAQIEKDAAKPVNAHGNHVAQLSEATKKGIQLELLEANARAELHMSTRWAPLLTPKEEAEERLSSSEAKLFMKEHKCECDVRFDQGREIGRKVGQEEGYYSGYNSGYAIAVSDTHNKTTNKLIEEAKINAKIEGIKEANQRWQTKHLPDYFGSFKTIKEEGEAALTAKLNAKFDQELQLQRQNDEREFVSLGYHMATTHQIRRQLGFKFEGDHVLHADFQGPRIGRLIADAATDGVMTNNWDKSHWHGALDENSEMWIHLPEGIDRTKTKNMYYERLVSSYTDRMQELLKELEDEMKEDEAKAARVAAAEHAARSEQVKNKQPKQEAFGSIQGLDGYTLKSRKPRSARPNPDSAKDSDHGEPSSRSNMAAPQDQHHDQDQAQAKARSHNPYEAYVEEHSDSDNDELEELVMMEERRRRRGNGSRG
jgi:hypothetical protein